MTSNLKKYKKDLTYLLDKGEQLLDSIQTDCKSESDKIEQIETDTNEFPSFLDEYQSWYSESLAVIQQLIPDRKDDFIKYYEQPKNRKSINYRTYKIEDYLMGLETEFNASKNIYEMNLNPLPDYLGIVTRQFQQQLAILRSAERRLKSSLFDIKQLLQADLFDSELSAATELNNKGFFRGAGAMAGVVLEGHLKEVCNRQKIEIKKTPTINNLSQLLKSNKVIDVPLLINIQRLAALRNLCDHKKEPEPTEEKVSELIEGVDKIIKTVF